MALLVWITLFVSGVSGSMAVMVWSMLFAHSVSGKMVVVVCSMLFASCVNGRMAVFWYEVCCVLKAYLGVSQCYYHSGYWCSPHTPFLAKTESLYSSESY